MLLSSFFTFTIVHHSNARGSTAPILCYRPPCSLSTAMLSSFKLVLLFLLVLSCSTQALLSFNHRVIFHPHRRKMELRSQSQSQATADGSNWRIWYVIDQLEAKQQQENSSDFITNKVIKVLHQWGSEWSVHS